MQSFKQYLLGEVLSSFPSNPYIDISTGIFTSEIEEWGITGDGDDDTARMFERWVSAHLQDHYENEEIDAYFDNGGELIIAIELSDENANLSSSHIQNTAKAALKVVDDLLNTKLEDRNIDSIYLTFRRALGPNVKTDWPYIQFYFHSSPPVSLQDIHKKIPNCKTLIFFHSIDKIKSNVLGLLKIKTLKAMTIWPTSSSPTRYEWLTILQKHFNGDKDIIECQRELIEKDLDEYAEL